MKLYAAIKFRIKVKREKAEKIFKVMKEYRERIKRIRILVKYLIKQGYSEEEALKIAIERYKMRNIIICGYWRQIDAYIKSKTYRADSLIVFLRYGSKYSVVLVEKNNKVFLRLRGDLNSWIPVKKTIYRAIKKREEWGWKPVFVILKFLCFTRRNGLFEVALIFKVPAKKITANIVKSALNENKLSIVSIDINAIHGVYYGLYRFQDSELKLIKVMKTNVDWRLVEKHTERKAELQSKLRRKGLSSSEFRELRLLERRISNLVQYPKRRGLSILRELIRREQHLGRKVIVVVEDIDKKDIEGMCNHNSRINRAISRFMQGWFKKIRFLCRIEGVFFMIVNKEYSSKQCPQCGKKMEYISNRWLYCNQCDKKYHRDLVALRNLAIRALEKIKKHNTSLP